MEKSCKDCQNREFCKFTVLYMGSAPPGCIYFSPRKSEKWPEEYSLFTWIKEASLDELAEFILSTSDQCNWCVYKYHPGICGDKYSQCKSRIKDYLLRERKDLFGK